MERELLPLRKLSHALAPSLVGISKELFVSYSDSLMERLAALGKLATLDCKPALLERGCLEALIIALRLGISWIKANILALPFASRRGGASIATCGT